MSDLRAQAKKQREFWAGTAVGEAMEYLHQLMNPYDEDPLVFAEFKASTDVFELTAIGTVGTRPVRVDIEIVPRGNTITFDDFKYRLSVEDKLKIAEDFVDGLLWSVTKM